MNRDLQDQFEVQEALQQQQIEGSQLVNAPVLHEQIQANQAVLVEQTNPQKVVRSVILRLRGLEERPDGSLIKVAEEKVNKVGIDNIWFILDSHINQNIILSHLKEKEISNIMDALQTDLVDDLGLNWREYGIKKKTDLDTINDSILTNIFASLKRAEGQNEKNWLKGITVENISNTSRQQLGKKDAFWDKFRIG